MVLLNPNNIEETVKQILSNREYEVFILVGKGYTNRAISQTLFLDIGYIEVIISSIYSKLHSGNSTSHPRVRVALLYHGININ
jgi:DNA-binding NarL/FixJ family response regulator